MKRAKTSIDGGVMTVELPRFNDLLIGGSTLLFTAVAVTAGALQLVEADRIFAFAAAPLGIAAGLYFAGRRKQLVLDRDAGTVVARQRWFVGSWEATEQTHGRPFGVERREFRASGGPSYFYAVMLGKLQLTHFPEAEDAEKLADALAKHMDVERKGTRDSKTMRKTLAARQKLAMLPIALTALALLVGGVLVALGRFA